MMKININICFFLVTIASYSQNEFPTYKEVVTTVFKKYEAELINENKVILFEKRDTGWTVTTMNPQLKDTISEIFWDNKTKRYNSIHFPLRINSYFNTDDVNDFIDSSLSIRYNSLQYFGYAGWDQDLIKLYENKIQLTDLELYGLGYAYANFANNLLNINYQFSDEKIKMNLPIAKNAMTTEQLQVYLSFQNKAIHAYLELKKRNPKFETIPGEIGIKYFNEIASCFLNLRIYQNDEVALEQLKNLDLYSENYKMYAKNMLDSCDQNAILFTAGDNDTYPLLMYQVQNNYRKDVLLINTSLLQDSRYVIRMKEPFLDSEGICLSIDSGFINDKLSDFLLIKKSKNTSISIENLNTIFLTDSILTASNVVSYKTISTNNFSFNKDNSVLNWNIKAQLIYRNQLMLLDIIGTNKWKRPIYFTTNNSTEDYLGLTEYFQFEGLVYKLVPNKGKTFENQIGFVNPEKIEKNRKIIFHFKNKTNLPVEERQLVMEFRFIYSRLADYYIEIGDFKKAELILDDCLLLFPNDMAFFNFDIISIMKSYYKLKSFEKTNRLKTQLLQNLKNGDDNYSFLNEDERKIKYDKLKNYLNALIDLYEK